MSRRHSTRAARSRRPAATPPSTGPAASPAPARPPAAAVTSPGASAVIDPDLLARLELSMQLEQRAAARAGETDPGALAEADAQPVSITTTVPVAGMTCRSCEVRIERSIRRLRDIERVSASAVRGRVEIESSSPIPPAAIAKAIADAGYEVGTTPWLERDRAVWITAAGGLVLVIALAVLAQLTGISNLAGAAGDLGSGGLLVALLLGLAAGVSTCMALVGGLVLALSAGYQARRAASGATGDALGSQMRPAFLFMGGRIVGYAVFGAMLGAVGASLTMPPLLTATMMIGVAAVMTILGTRLTGLSPRVATWSPTLPMGLGRRLGLDAGGAGSYSDGRAAALGALSFFLPCGFTQAVQIYALSTGSPVFAGALLAVFAIGTAPGLLALAGLPVVVPGHMRPTLLRVVGVVVIGFAFVNASAGLQLAGIGLPLPGVGGVAAAAPSPAVAPVGGAQALATTQEVDGYSPKNVSIYAGIPTTWTIDSKSSASCAASIVVPALNIFQRLEKGPNTIELPALPVGTLRYTCAMGMYGGSITVVAPPTGSVDGGAPSGG